MDLHGNLEGAVLDVTAATFTGNFGLKYRGIGYNSARALTNPTTLAVMIPHVLPLNSASDRKVAGAKNARREVA